MDSICLAQSADILLLGLFFFLLLAPLQHTRFYPALRLLLAIGIPPLVLQRCMLLSTHPLSHIALLALAICWAALVLLLAVKLPPRYHSLLRHGGTIGAAMALFALLNIAQLLWLLRWKPLPQQYTAAWATTRQPPRNHPLLVWVILDELSYDQTFEHRAPGLALPNFDALRSQSTLFTDVQPVGYWTAKVIPSLLSGQTIDDMRFGMDNRFSVHHLDAPGWHTLSGQDSVFADAQQNGWRTAVVGWYNPYCTTYRSAIDNCYWSNQDSVDDPMALHNTVLQNIRAGLGHFAQWTLSPAHAAQRYCDLGVAEHAASLQDLEPHMLQLLHTDQADFVFLHLGAPHGPGIWNRRASSYTSVCGSSYVDNLALADRELGLILGTLRQSPRWSQTTLIVQGDHSWRTALWKQTSSWTPEEEAASRGVFDPRPALIIHQSGQTQPQTNATAWPLLRVHDVVEQILRNQPINP
jgi:hypothetical protein